MGSIIFHLQKCNFRDLNSFSEATNRNHHSNIAWQSFPNDLHSYLKALIWTISFFFLSIASNKHPNHLTGGSDEDMIPYDREIVFQVYMIQLFA